jgi:uncharacterized protein YoxC
LTIPKSTEIQFHAEKEGIMNGVFLGLITAAVVALTVFLIRLMLKVDETVKMANKLLETTDQNLRETTIELNLNLRNLRQITGDISKVTGDVASFTDSVRGVGEEVKHLTENIKGISQTVRDLGVETTASVSGVRAGVTAGIDFLLRNFLQNRTGR